MDYFAAAQETSRATSSAQFQRFQTEARLLRVKALKLFRILVILWGLSTTFWDMVRFINQSLFSLVQAQADYTYWKDSSLNIG